MRRGPMVFGRELQVRRGPMVSGATGAQRANGRLSLLSAGKRSPKCSKKHCFLRCLRDRLHVGVTIFPSSELQEQTGAQRADGFSCEKWSQEEG